MGWNLANLSVAGAMPILIYLTAMGQEIDIVNSYDTWADDYITKPFSVNILTSKVNAFMRR